MECTLALTSPSSHLFTLRATATTSLLDSSFVVFPEPFHPSSPSTSFPSQSPTSQPLSLGILSYTCTSLFTPLVHSQSVNHHVGKVLSFYELPSLPSSPTLTDIDLPLDRSEIPSPTLSSSPSQTLRQPEPDTSPESASFFGPVAGSSTLSPQRSALVDVASSSPLSSAATLDQEQGDCRTVQDSDSDAVVSGPANHEVPGRGGTLAITIKANRLGLCYTSLTLVTGCYPSHDPIADNGGPWQDLYRCMFSLWLPVAFLILLFGATQMALYLLSPRVEFFRAQPRPHE